MLPNRCTRLTVFPSPRGLSSRFSQATSLSLSRMWKRRWSSNASEKCSYERPTRGTVCGTMRSMCGADASCSAINYQSFCHRRRRRKRWRMGRAWRGWLQRTTPSSAPTPPTSGSVCNRNLQSFRFWQPLPSEEGTTQQHRNTILRTFTRKPRPESGLDCLTCAIFARWLRV